MPEIDETGRPSEAERVQLRDQAHLLLAENPNYFGNLPATGLKAVVELGNDTYFEQLTCVGYNPGRGEVEATVQIKRAGGYGSDLCGPGSREWLRFYVSYDDGATWQDVGLGSFLAHNIPDQPDCAGQPGKPLSYTVAYPLPDPKRRPCPWPVLPLVRAILSWQVIPPAGQPNWQPVWGNHLDRHVQLAPSPWFLHDLIDVLGVKTVPPLLQPLLDHPLPELPDQSLDLAQSAAIAHESEVPPHRFAAPLVAAALSEGPVAQSVLADYVAQAKAIDLSWSELVSKYLSQLEDTTYERLNCLGVDYNRDLLVATFQLRQPGGFSGPLCGPGSTEYVAFWVDYDNTCRWTYAGTASVRVHDFPKIPADGLHYWAFLPADIAEHRRTCQQPKVARIRAVLSWNTPPSTTDPYAHPRWGNAVETHIEIRPGGPISTVARIDTIGDISVLQIGPAGQTLPTATFGYTGSPADQTGLGRPCPFGGRVVVGAAVPDSFSASNEQYRLLWRVAGSTGTGTPITDPFVTADSTTTTTRTPDPVTGLTPYLPSSANIHSVVGWWQTRGVVVDGTYEISLERFDAVGNHLDQTQWYAVKTDNTPPTADITLSGGSPCNKANPGDTVGGTFTATDANFGWYSLDTLPASLNPPAPAHNPLSTTNPVPSGTWSLVTDGSWAQCGYVVQLWVYDRSIVDSFPNSHNYGYDDVGFCLGL